MKISFIFLIAVITLMSCHRRIYGFYDSSHMQDESAYLSIDLRQDGTVQKNEVHVIRISSAGIWKNVSTTLYCYFEPTDTGFPADTTLFKVRGRKLMFIENEGINHKVYLKRVSR